MYVYMYMYVYVYGAHLDFMLLQGGHEISDEMLSLWSKVPLRWVCLGF